MRLTSIADLKVPGSQALEQLAYTLTKLYDDFLDDFPENGPEREAGIHATELNTCLRQVVYTIFNTPKQAKIDAMWRKKFEVGHAIHNMIQSHFKMMADASNGRMTFDSEVRCQETPLGRELCLCSSCDGIFTFWENGSPILRVSLEIKSKSPEEYKKLKKPEQKHVEQSHLYMACLDVPLTWVLYWDKGSEHYTPSLSPYLIRFDPSIWARLLDRAHTALDFANDGKLPDPEPCFECKWCPYAYTCNPPNVRHNRVNMPILGKR